MNTSTRSRAVLAVLATTGLSFLAGPPNSAAEPLAPICTQRAVINRLECENYYYTGDPRYADYGYQCGHDIYLNAQDCYNAFNPPRPVG